MRPSEREDFAQKHERGEPMPAASRARFVAYEFSMYETR
jgi:hypothetical protein